MQFSDQLAQSMYDLSFRPNRGLLANGVKNGTLPPSYKDMQYGHVQMLVPNGSIPNIHHDNNRNTPMEDAIYIPLVNKNNNNNNHNNYYHSNNNAIMRAGKIYGMIPGAHSQQPIYGTLSPHNPSSTSYATRNECKNYNQIPLGPNDLDANSLISTNSLSGSNVYGYIGSNQNEPVHLEPSEQFRNSMPLETHTAKLIKFERYVRALHSFDPDNFVDNLDPVYRDSERKILLALVVNDIAGIVTPAVQTLASNGPINAQNDEGESANNGWLYGENLRTHRTGWFPESFTAPFTFNHSQMTVAETSTNRETYTMVGGKSSFENGYVPPLYCAPVTSHNTVSINLPGLARSLENRHSVYSRGYDILPSDNHYNQHWISLNRPETIYQAQHQPGMTQIRIPNPPILHDGYPEYAVSHHVHNPTLRRPVIQVPAFPGLGGNEQLTLMTRIGSTGGIYETPYIGEENRGQSFLPGSIQKNQSHAKEDADTTLLSSPTRRQLTKNKSLENIHKQQHLILVSNNVAAGINQQNSGENGNEVAKFKPAGTIEKDSTTGTKDMERTSISTRKIITETRGNGVPSGEKRDKNYAGNNINNENMGVGDLITAAAGQNRLSNSLKESNYTDGTNNNRPGSKRGDLAHQMADQKMDSLANVLTELKVRFNKRDKVGGPQAGANDAGPSVSVNGTDRCKIYNSGEESSSTYVSADNSSLKKGGDGLNKPQKDSNLIGKTEPHLNTIKNIKSTPNNAKANPFVPSSLEKGNIKRNAVDYQPTETTISPSAHPPVPPPLPPANKKCEAT